MITAEREQWFIDRIGKILYRNKTSCDCPVCDNVYEHGLLVHDKYHAQYIYECECDFNEEGSPIKYFDTKEEVRVYEEEIKLIDGYNS